MVRLIVMFVAGLLFLAIGVRSLSFPNANYVLTAGNFLTGFGLILYAWFLRKNGKGNLAAAIVFIVGCILTVTGNFL